MPGSSPERPSSPRSHSVVLDQQGVAAARLFAASHFPYLATALFAMVVVAAPESGTVAVDAGWTLHADPDVLAGMEAPELGKLLVHLVAHLLREHADRAGCSGISSTEEAVRWNRAADAEINDDLVAGAMLPASAPELPADVGGADGDLAEAYYETAGEGPRRWDCGSGCDGVRRPWDTDGDGLGAREAGWLRLSVADAIRRSHGTDPGSVPDGWLRWAEALIPSRIDWRRVLAAEVRAAVHSVAGMVDYTYRRPSRRAALTAPVVLPALYRPTPEIAVVCDTSGSMHEELLARVLVEVEAILRRAGLRDRSIRVLSCDATVHAARRVSRASQVALVGGGGTDMGAGIEAAYNLRPRPTVIVVLTDGYTPWPEQPAPGVRVVVGLLRDRGYPAWSESPPGWTRVVEIEA